MALSVHAFRRAKSRPDLADRGISMVISGEAAAATAKMLNMRIWVSPCWTYPARSARRRR
jgi:hypothetical protein